MTADGGPEFLVDRGSDDSADEVLPGSSRRPRWRPWLVGGAGALLVVVGGIRLATSDSSGPSPADSSSPATVEPAFPDFSSAGPPTPSSSKSSFRGIVPAVPGRQARTVTVDLPGDAGPSCAARGGCDSVTTLPSRTVAAVHEALSDVVLQFFTTIVRRKGEVSTLVVRQIIATAQSHVVVITVERPSRPRSLDRAGDNLIVQRVVGGAQIRVEVRGETSAGLGRRVDRLAVDARLLALR